MNNILPTVLVCPIDWGLGHASRVIPLIYNFRKAGHKVFIAGSGKSGMLLKSTFNDLTFLDLPCSEVKYFFRGKLFFLNIFLQLPALIFSAIRDNIYLKRLIKVYRINIVVSDNRYGLFSRSTRNIIVTHQISPVLPGLLKWAEYPVYCILKMLIHRFDECWIPDFSGENNLSGKLSHRFRLPENAKYIGILSRFSVIKPLSENEQFDIVIVLSGPQPELGRLTRKIIDQAKDTDQKILIICGLQNLQDMHSEEQNLRIVSHLEPSKFRNALEHALVVICTAGYSGIMDLVEINKPAILIPTDGQSEQEYLVKYLQSQGIFKCMPGPGIDLKQKEKYAELIKQCKVFKKDGEVISDLPILQQTQ